MKQRYALYVSLYSYLSAVGNNVYYYHYYIGKVCLCGLIYIKHFNPTKHSWSAVVAKSTGIANTSLLTKSRCMDFVASLVGWLLIITCFFLILNTSEQIQVFQFAIFFFCF